MWRCMLIVNGLLGVVKETIKTLKEMSRKNRGRMLSINAMLDGEDLIHCIDPCVERKRHLGCTNENG